MHNDSMFLKRELVDAMVEEQIYRFIFIAENVLNFHGDETDYYEEWYDDLQEYQGWAVVLNLQPHVLEEMQETRLDDYLHLGTLFNDINWRPHEPARIYEAIEGVLSQETRRIY